jgi:hypothetical protein
MPQPPQTKARGLSAGNRQSQPEKEEQLKVTPVVHKRGKVRPADEMRKGEPSSERVRTAVGKERDDAPWPDSNSPQIERPSVPPSDARDTEQRTSDLDGHNLDKKKAGPQEKPAPQATFAPEKVINPVPAAPVEYDSGAALIVRPERVTVRERADSPARAATPETTSIMQAAPTIKVTIGRIEVRAVQPPATRAQETALPAPRMSLDDYLKSLSGGRR